MCCSFWPGETGNACFLWTRSSAHLPPFVFHKLKNISSALSFWDWAGSDTRISCGNCWLWVLYVHSNTMFANLFWYLHKALFVNPSTSFLSLRNMSLCPSFCLFSACLSLDTLLSWDNIFLFPLSVPISLTKRMITKIFMCRGESSQLTFSHIPSLNLRASLFCLVLLS